MHGKFDGLARLLVGCHPAAWRRRYAAEVLAVLDQHEVTARTVLNLWVSAVSAQLDPAWRSRADSPHGLSISPDGRLLAAASTTSPGTVALWDVADPARPARIAVLTGAAGQAGGISALSFSPDGHLLTTASNNGTVVLRDVTRPAAPAVTATLRFTVPAWRFAGS